MRWKNQSPRMISRGSSVPEANISITLPSTAYLIYYAASIWPTKCCQAADLSSAAWLLHRGAIVSWSARAAEPFRNLPMKDYVKERMSLPRIWDFIPDIIFPSSLDYVRGVIETATVDRIRDA